MSHPIVHFEIIGKDPDSLRIFYKELFGWEADTHSAVAPEVSEAGNYGFIDAPDGANGIPGGIGGGKAYESHAVFYVGVDDVEAALAKAESLGGKRVVGPVKRPDGGVTVGHFTDPEGSLVGVAGPR